MVVVGVIVLLVAVTGKTVFYTDLCVGISQYLFAVSCSLSPSPPPLLTPLSISCIQTLLLLPRKRKHVIHAESNKLKSIFFFIACVMLFNCAVLCVAYIIIGGQAPWKPKVVFVEVYFL